MNPTLEAAQTMSMGVLSALPPHALANLQQQANQGMAHAKAAKEWVDGAIAQKYAGDAQSKRQDLDKDTGSVVLVDEGYRITADLPKRTHWDQKMLAGIAKRIVSSGDDPAQFMEIAYKVPERKYQAWPDSIRDAFTPARTLKTGKQTFKLTPIDGGEL